MRKILILIFLTSLYSCNLFDQRENEVFLTDKDYFENYRELSPNKSMILINYSIDLGAFGYGQSGTAILKVFDTTKDLRQFSIPNTITDVKWIDNINISGKKNIIPSIRIGENIELKNYKINNVTVKITASDNIAEKSKLKIEYREISPNKENELIAYRYINNKNEFSPINISIINPGNKIPKYGNFYIGEKQSDFILNGKWNKQNQLVFYSNNQDADLVNYYLVENRPNVKFSIIKDEKKYGGKYLWWK